MNDKPKATGRVSNGGLCRGKGNRNQHHDDFRSGREFASFLGLVPRQSGTGGRVRLLGISKWGDTYLRSLLTHGARAVVNRQIHNRNPWIDRLLSRRQHNVAVVALANKMARTIWALLARDRSYDPMHQRTVTAA